MLRGLFKRFLPLISIRHLFWALPALATPSVWAQTSSVPVAVVSAASFNANAIAPDCAASAFGANLATDVFIANKLPLPTSLGGTTVKVNNKPAQLFFVAPGQINFVVPAEAGTGDATIEVTAGNGVVSRGAFRIVRAAPALFTTNGAPLGYLLRFRGSNSIPNQPPVTEPIDLGPPGDSVYLIFYLSGIRNAPDTNQDGNVNESVRVILGGSSIQPEYAGASPDLAGADQINLILPQTLIGRGRVSLSVSSDGKASNQVELNFATPTGPAPPRISGFSEAQALAGQTLTINGAGFATNALENIVRIGDVDARIVPDKTTPTQVTVEVPFGAKSGKVTVSNTQGEGVSPNPLKVRTSISGFIVDTSPQPQPLRNVLVVAKVEGKPDVMIRTTDKGTFVLPDMAPGNASIRVDGSSVSAGLPYTTWDTKLRVLPNQDNRFDAPIAIQQITGNSSLFEPDSSAKPAEKGKGRSVFAKAQTPIRLTAEDVVLEIPAGTTITFPPDAQPKLSLTLVAGSRAPTRLPEAIFSERIVQITPFGATIDTGAKLTFPNRDALPAGTKLDLYKFDKDKEINFEEGFVKIGTATVSADGRRVETSADAIKITSYFFVALRQQQTTAIGQIVENDKPVSQAIVQVRGQNDFSDGNGGFAQREVAVKSGQSERIQAETSVQRSNGRVEYTVVAKDPAPGGITDFGRISINSLTTNLPPVLLVPAQIQLNTGVAADTPFTAYDPDDAQSITVQFTLERRGPNGNPDPRFCRIQAPGSNGEGFLKFSPQEGDVGEYTLTISVKDNAGDQSLVVRQAIAISVVGIPGMVTFDAQPVLNCESSIPSGPSIRLSWAATARAQTYDVFRGSGELIAGNLSETTFTDMRGLTAGGTYIYRVVAKNPSGNGPPSESVSVQIPQNICFSKPVTISFDTVTGATTQGGTITVPVLAGDLSGRGVIAYEFELFFNSDVLQFLGTDSNATLSSGMNVVSNAGGNSVKVAAFVGASIGGPSRTLLKLRFLVRGGTGSSSPLRWERFLLNEGDPLPSTKNDIVIIR
ncbi:MAG TPA: IPT/TIG domain-containing protein [Blastocatellia bacterium]|nr:IPT/TIG domain-containing protein [Blastocatellia bacterium]HMZ19564.1 IPT/TIG domain-containing protein [Blastocatellia bacterium]HNG34124.1 IPT/TIG domain-containing protein [Blastocatellia bacterium]